MNLSDYKQKKKVKEFNAKLIGAGLPSMPKSTPGSLGKPIQRQEVPQRAPGLYIPGEDQPSDSEGDTNKTLDEILLKVTLMEDNVQKMMTRLDEVDAKVGTLVTSIGSGF